MRKWATRLCLGISALSAIAAEGCAQERDPINRVQSGTMQKQFFVGDVNTTADDPEFYWRTYVVDHTASQEYPGVGTGSQLDRIRWEITENMLIARKAYEIADGRDGKGLPPGESLYTDRDGKKLRKAQNGTIIAAYKIEKHFDIRREYNAQTGEEHNVIEENDSDRPWYQREFMRVDWSKSLEGSDAWAALQDPFGVTRLTPVAYYVTDPNDEDAPHLEEKDGYLDFTGKLSVTPETVNFYGYELPGCLLTSYFLGSTSYECDPQELKVRTSLWKIQADRDFEPFENTEAARDIYGNAGTITSRQGWDPQYGHSDALFHQYNFIHNNWKKSHQDNATCSSNVDDDRDGTADACSNATTGYSGSSGSQCDTTMKKCTIPLRDRQLKPIAYWVNREVDAQNPELLDSTDGKQRGSLEDIVYSWNQLMSVGIATGREVECQRTGDGNRDTCHSRYFSSSEDPATKEMLSYGNWLVHKASEATPALVFCHNPVREYDNHEACGETGAIARLGDVRKNFIFYYPNASRAPYGGVVNWSADPLTGEFVGATATIMGRSATRAAAEQRDVIQVAMGDTTLTDLIDGNPSEMFTTKFDWSGALTKGLPAAEIKKRLSQIDQPTLAASVGARPRTGTIQDLKSLTTNADAVEAAQKEFQQLANRLNPMADTVVDNQWLRGTLGFDKEIAQGSAFGPFLSTNTRFASPLAMFDPVQLGTIRSTFEAQLAERGACFIGPEGTSGAAAGSVVYASLAPYFRQKYADLSVTERGQAIYNDLLKETVKGIGLHEFGHSLGMRHNFASSWDSPNYNPQYWQLRTNEGAKTDACSESRTDGADTCMGPRYLDPETPDEAGTADESRPNIQYFANTSTMEYQIERAAETVGLGTYDQFFMKALYGRALEAFDTNLFSKSAQEGFRFKNYSQTTSDDWGMAAGKLATRHYTSLAREMKVFDAARDCRDATDDERARGVWRIVHGKVCSPQPKQHFHWNDFASASLDPANDPEGDFTAPRWKATDRDGVDHVRWPYRYGEQYSSSYLHANSGDSGADVYEVTRNAIREFEAKYPLTYFRRKNREYAYWSGPLSNAMKVFEQLRSYHWNIANDLATAGAADIQSDDSARPAAVAGKEIFDFFLKAITAPEPGIYIPSSTMGQNIVDAPNLFDTKSNLSEDLIKKNKIPYSIIGIQDGRFIGEKFDNHMGGSWDYHYFPQHAGFGIEKAMAMTALVDSRSVLSNIARENFLDGRGAKMSFRTDMPLAIDRLLGGLLAEDWETVSVAQNDSACTPPDLNATIVPQTTKDEKILHPNIGYRQQILIAMKAAIFSRMNTDMTIVNKLRIWRAGDNGALDVPESETIRLVDPETHATYVAVRFGEETIRGRIADRGIGSRMLAHATAIAAKAFDENSKVKDLNAQRQFRNYVGLIDQIREITRRLDSPLGASNDD